MLDHVVLATHDISETSRWIAERTGVTPTPGGPHIGRGTRNELCSLGESSYLEIIGPDSSLPTPSTPMPFGLDNLEASGVVTWCSKRTDLRALIEAAARHGLDIAGPMPMQRQAPEGMLEWELAIPNFDTEGGTLPFFIDWGSSPHPAATVPATLELVSFEADHPDPAGLMSRLELLDERLTVNQAATAGLRVSLAGPNGTVVLPAATFN